jgi:UDP-N-acetylmuramate dehydrogenase
MKIGGNARFMTEIHTPEEIETVYKNAKKQSLPIFVIGGGSNVIAKDEGYSGIIVRIRIPGFEVIADDLNSTTIRIGAGENWDSVVKRTVDMGLSGIESMSGIPGTAGAGPVQNMGAYGQEIADTLQSLSVFDSQTGIFILLTNDDCKFSYRNSIFRDSAKGRYVIASIVLKLSKNQPQPPFYEALQKYFDEHNIKLFTQKVVRDAVLDLRNIKLPDPTNLPNSGSFFKNAIVEAWQTADLKKIDPNIPLYDMGDGKFKVPTGWLIENVGLKGQLLHGIRIYDKNALVLVNESAASYADLAKARDEIVRQVISKFHIQIEQEPLEI